MCNRYRMTARQAELAAAYGIVPPYPADLTIPPPELFPKRPAFVVREEDGARRVDTMTWGFPPPAAARAPVTNVRKYASPFWRGALAKPDRRCLVPVSEFCEWEGEKGQKVARWFSIPSRPLFSFAGVWRPTEDGATYAFLTTDPNPLVGAVHLKAMPVILHEEDYDRWLRAPTADAIELAAPYPSQLMSMA